MGTSTKPYLLRALYEWCCDNGQTPHLLVWVDARTQVPLEFVKNNEIVLNVGPSACRALKIDNDWISFSARFGGVAREIWIPVGNVMSIFARESGEGMGFEVETEELPDEAPPVPASGAPAPDDEPPPRPSGPPSLRIVK